MDILIKALQLILSISILVITHEAGHFAFAKLFKTKVEKFYLFFDPWFSLFKFKRGETEYGIGWLPLGGYVKIAGMIDESMDKEQMKQPAQPWEFRSKPAWQRLLVMLGGVLVNAITAPIIFWFVLFVWGEEYIPTSEAKFGMQFHELLQKNGFQNGDRIISIDGDSVETYSDINQSLIYKKDGCTVNIIRNDSIKMDITIPNEFFRQILTAKASNLIQERFPIVIDSVIPNSGAARGGLLRGDSIVAINGNNAGLSDSFTKILSQYSDTTLEFVVYHNGALDTTQVNIDGNGKIGIYMYGATRWMKPKTKTYGFFEAFPAGIQKGYDLLVLYVKQLPMIFTKEGATQIGGFGAIAKMFPGTWNWYAFWYQTAFLAIILAFMNILPIPALDGGHVLFLLIEIVTRRKPSEKVLEYAQVIGMILLFGLLIYANGLDILRAIGISLN